MRPFRAETGFSALEVFVTVAMVGVLAAFAVPNVQLYHQFARNKLAQKDYSEIRDALSQLKKGDLDSSNLIVLAQDGPKELPEPLSHIRLTEGNTLDYLYDFTLGSGTRFSALQIHHSEGSRTYRYLQVNGKTLEQVF
ncbi:MAG: type II secretion system protein [Bdellovibrionales bacterium]|nr:type II secretion system protein [Bdellovibrionales bacterium]